jgi:hypothetical protein
MNEKCSWCNENPGVGYYKIYNDHAKRYQEDKNRATEMMKILLSNDGNWKLAYSGSQKYCSLKCLHECESNRQASWTLVTHNVAGQIKKKNDFNYAVQKAWWEHIGMLIFITILFFPLGWYGWYLRIKYKNLTGYLNRKS